jgi:hypothetical protein
VVIAQLRPSFRRECGKCTVPIYHGCKQHAAKRRDVVANKLLRQLLRRVIRSSVTATSFCLFATALGVLGVFGNLQMLSAGDSDCVDCQGGWTCMDTGSVSECWTGTAFKGCKANPCGPCFRTNTKCGMLYTWNVAASSCYTNAKTVCGAQMCR